MEVNLLNSGGLDSAMVAKWLMSQGVTVHSVYIDTRAENRVQAMLASEETATRYCADHRVVSVDFGMTSTEVTPDHTTSIPLSSLLVGSVGAVDARLHGITEVYTGHRSNASADRIEMLNDFVATNPYNTVKPHINTPILTATDYASAATMLGVSLDDLSYTHSCVHAEPCGTCGVCLSRANLWTP